MHPIRCGRTLGHYQTTLSAGERHCQLPRGSAPVRLMRDENDTHIPASIFQSRVRQRIAGSCMPRRCKAVLETRQVLGTAAHLPGAFHTTTCAPRKRPPAKRERASPQSGGKRDELACAAAQPRRIVHARPLCLRSPHPAASAAADGRRQRRLAVVPAAQARALLRSGAAAERPVAARLRLGRRAAKMDTTGDDAVGSTVSPSSPSEASQVCTA